MRLDLAQTATWLAQHDNYLILTHRRPDGDTVGCAAALCLGLRQLGKTAAVLDNPQFTPLYRPYLKDTIQPAPPDATVISVDLATEDLLPLGETDFTGKTQLAIDHHASHRDYAPLSLVEGQYAACGESIYELLLLLGVTIDTAIGEALYVAISTDTGCFKYSNTGAHTFRVAAALKELGIDTYRINKQLFVAKTLTRMRLEAWLTEHLTFYADGLVGVSTLPQSVMQQLHVTEDDADGVSGFARNVQGVQIAVMIRELSPTESKISLRTGDDYNASDICRRLGGGGHRAAAGATVDGDLQAAEQAILQAIRQSGIPV